MTTYEQMRDVLIAMLDEKCKQCYINDQICTQGLECHWNGKRGEICQDEAIDKAIAALAAPPRNCDRFTSESEMKAAFIDYYNEVWELKGTSSEIDYCDLKHNIDGILHDYIEWLLAEAKGGAK